MVIVSIFEASGINNSCGVFYEARTYLMTYVRRKRSAPTNHGVITTFLPCVYRIKHEI